MEPKQSYRKELKGKLISAGILVQGLVFEGNPMGLLVGYLSDILNCRYHLLSRVCLYSLASFDKSAVHLYIICCMMCHLCRLSELDRHCQFCIWCY